MQAPLTVPPRAVAVLAVLVLASPLAGAGFPPVSGADRRLAAVPGAPDATAVILYEKADFTMMDPSIQRMTSILHVERRIKVLSEAGAERFGEIAVPHSRRVRLSNFAGRTVSPGGEVLPVGEESIFERRTSRAEREFVTAVAFPSVEPGAILDYRYDLRFDSIFYLEPWTFQNEVPTLRSEITYHIPGALAVGTSGRGLPGHRLEHEIHPEKDGRRLTVWAEDLPAIPDEPYGPPDADMTARFLVVPHAYVTRGTRVPLMESWEAVCDLVDEGLYAPARKRDRGVERRARQIVADREGEGAAARALYRFVRDQVTTYPSWDVLAVDDGGVRDVLERGRGTPTDKALLLVALLDAAGIPAELVWAPDRDDGLVDMDVPNPYWFERTLVRLEGPDGAVFLDPSDPRLGYGQLRAVNEGQSALVFDRKAPRRITLPRRPFTAHQRRAEVDLELTGEGRLVGSGRLVLTGHHAHLALAPGADPEELVATWTESVEERLPGFELTELEVAQSRAEARLAVRFTVRQRDEEVLGDEVTFLASRPLGPAEQLFELPAERRKTPVLLAFGDREELEVTLAWPQGWTVERAPGALGLDNSAGSATYSLDGDRAARTLVFRRVVEVRRSSFVESADYADLYRLLENVEAQDAEPLVLVRR